MAPAMTAQRHRRSLDRAVVDGSSSSPSTGPRPATRSTPRPRSAIGAAMDRLDDDRSLVAGVSPAPAARSAPAWTSRRSSRGERPSIAGPRLRRHRRAAAGQAADRRGRGLRPRRRLRDRAGLRPARRRRGREVRPARGQARPGRRGRRAAAAARSGCPHHLAMEWALTGEPIPADAAARGRAGQPAHADGRRARRGARRWPARSPPTARSPSRRASGSSSSRRDWPAAERFDRQREINEPVRVVRGRPRGRHRLQGEARRRAGRAAEPLGARTAISAPLDGTEGDNSWTSASC